MAPHSISLNPDHNNGGLVSKKVQWQDLRNLTFQQDKSQVLGLDPSFEEAFEDWRRVPVYNGDKYSDWLHLTNTDRDFISDYGKLQEFSWRQKDDATTGFIWEIHSSFYESNLFEEPMLPEQSKEIQDLSNYDTKMWPLLMTYRHLHPKVKKDWWGCLDTNDDDSMEPSNMHVLRKRLKRRVQRKSPQNTTVYGYFHIRRGDTIDVCETSLEVLQDFMECSLNGTESTGKHITFLIGSDEKDDAYRQNVLKLSNRFSHVSMLDADKLEAQVIKEVVKNCKEP